MTLHMPVNLKKAKHKKHDKHHIGSAKGVETLYRNAYRAELDLIALAATKSNIMISINGFIVSALIISGGFLDMSKPLVLGPAVVFLFASAISIYFALLAASPDTTPIYQKLRNYLAQWWPALGTKTSTAEPANILIYEDRVKLSKCEYLKQMRKLLSNQDQVYETMSDQLYWLGEMADRKFKMLKTSYATLRWGVIGAVVLFLGIKGYDMASHSTGGLLDFAPSAVASSKNSPELTGRQAFSEIYEASAATQLPDGRLLVLEDESRQAMSLVSLNPEGSVQEDETQDKQLIKSFKRQLEDLEGIALGKEGAVYATTSFSLTKKGKRAPEREQLLRFTLEDGVLKSGSAYMDFGDFLRQENFFDRFRHLNGGDSIDTEQLNIEALSFDEHKQQLLFGFRAPLVDGKSMIVRMSNPRQVFEDQAQPILSDEVSLLDLNGGGIRSLVYDMHLGAYLLASEQKNAKGKWRPQLWLWSGESDQHPEPLDIPAMKKMKNIEAITPVVIGGVAKVMLLSDDGNRKKDRPAHYLFLDYSQIKE